MSTGLFLWLARKEFITKGLMVEAIEGADKTDLRSVQDLAKTRGFVYHADDSLGNMGFGTRWDPADEEIIISGPSENISVPAMSHEMGHVRVFKARLAKGKKPMVLDIEKNWLNRKLGTMSFYEYFMEKDAWDRCGYLHSPTAGLALKRYRLRALVSIFDTTALVLIIWLVLKVVL